MCLSYSPFILFCTDNGPLNWHRGNVFPTRIELPWITPYKKLIVYLDKAYPTGGVITYDVVILMPEKLPVIVPESDWIKIKELLKQMALDLDHAKDIAKEFIRKNPELAATIVTVGIGAVIIATGSEIGSWGTSSAMSLPLAAAGCILITVAFDVNK